MVWRDPLEQLYFTPPERGIKVATDVSEKYRHLFPVLEKVTYVNACSQGALAIPVRDALNEYLDGMYERGSLWDQWVMKQEELRALTAKAFSTKPENVAITSSASAGINSVLSSFDFSKGKNKIVTTDLEFPTMGQILHAQERRGAKVVHVPSEPDNTLDLSKLEAALTSDVALLAVTHVCYRNGALTDIKAVTQLGHKYGIPVLVDAYQSVGSMAIDFEDVGADFLVGGYLKYFLGIPGIGFLLARPDSPLVPSLTGWFAAADIFEMRIDTYDPAQDARRFSMGTPPVPSVYGAVAGLELMLDVGLDNAWRHTLELHRELRESLNEFGAKFATPSDLHGVMLAVKAKDDHLLVEELEKGGVVASSRDGNLRVSPHFYNSSLDIQHVVEVLGSKKELLA